MIEHLKTAEEYMAAAKHIIEVGRKEGLHGEQEER